MSNQLQMFEVETLDKSTSLLSEALAKISHLQENAQDLVAKEVHSYEKQLGLSKNANLVFVWENVKGTFSSNNRNDFTAILQAFANIGGYRLEWQLLNTKWFLPQNKRESTLSDILEDEVEDKYFLSQKTVDRLMTYKDNKTIPVHSQQDTTQQETARTLLNVNSMHKRSSRNTTHTP